MAANGVTHALRFAAVDDKDWTEVEPGTVLVATSGIEVRAQRLAIAG